MTAIGRGGGSHISNCHTGAVSFIQRWGGSLNLNPHFHIIFLNGVFQTYDSDDKEPVFIKASPMQETETLDIVKDICREVTEILISRGYLECIDDEISEVVQEKMENRDLCVLDVYLIWDYID